jgi:hypothetical protein
MTREDDVSSRLDVLYHSRSVCGPTWCWAFWRKKITDVFFYVPNVPISTRIHGISLCRRRCLGDLFWRCFLDGLMFCRAGLKLFRTSWRGLLCHIGPSSMLSRHYTGSKSGKITDKIVMVHEFWLVPYTDKNSINNRQVIRVCLQYQ